MLSTFFGPSGLSDWFENVAPYAQVRESDNATMLEMELPRYRMEDIKIDADVQNGLLTVSGHQPSNAAHEQEFDRLMWSSASLGDFHRSFSFSPRWYDLSRYTTKLDAGVLSIVIPKREQPQQQQQLQQQQQPLRVFGGDQKGQLVTTTTPEEFRAVCTSRWPPTIRREESASELTYKCEMPPTITKEHIKLELLGRALNLSVAYNYSIKTHHREESQSLTYSTTLTVPQGTKSEDISTTYESGVMTISLAKHQAAPAIEHKAKAKQ